MKKTRNRLSCSLFCMCSNFVIFFMVLRGAIKGIHRFRDKYLLVLTLCVYFWNIANPYLGKSKKHTKNVG